MTIKKFCIVGYGNHAQNKILPILKEMNINSISVVSNKKNIEKNVNTYASLDQALSDLNSDTYFIICSPPHLHFSQAYSIIENGFNVFIEKPIFLSLIELKKIIQLCEKKKVFFVENFMYQYSGFYKKFIDFVDLNRESIEKIYITFTLPKLPKNTFRQKIQKYPINIFDIGCYVISILNELLIEDDLIISEVSNKGDIEKELFTIYNSKKNIEVEIVFGVSSVYKNSIKVKTINNISHEFEPFFYGRESRRYIYDSGKKISDSEVINVEDSFKNMFQQKDKFWIDSQKNRNQIMLKNLSSLEKLCKQYNDI